SLAISEQERHGPGQRDGPLGQIPLQPKSGWQRSPLVAVSDESDHDMRALAESREVARSRNGRGAECRSLAESIEQGANVGSRQIFFRARHSVVLPRLAQKIQALARTARFRLPRGLER